MTSNVRICELKGGMENIFLVVIGHMINQDTQSPTFYSQPKLCAASQLPSAVTYSDRLHAIHQ